MAGVTVNLNDPLRNTGLVTITLLRVFGNVISQTPWLPLYSRTDLPPTRAPAANLQGTTREFKYTSSIVYPSALTALATLGSFSCKPRAFFHSSGMPSLAVSTGGSPDA